MILTGRQLLRFSPAQISRRLRRDAHMWHQLMDQLPRNLNDILEKISAGTLNVHLEHRRLSFRGPLIAHLQ